MRELSEQHGMTGKSGKIEGYKWKNHFIYQDNNTEIRIKDNTVL